MHAEADRDELTTPGLEITICWGTSVLHTASLTPPRSFYLGERDADFHVAASVLGADRTPVILVEGDRVLLVLPEGARGSVTTAGEAERPLDDATARLLPFPLGSSARLELGAIGDLTVCIASARAGKAVAGHYHLDKRAWPFVAASALVQAGLLGALAVFTPALGPDEPSDTPTDLQIDEMRIHLEIASERELEETDQAEGDAKPDQKSGGTGTRAKGEAGSMGRGAVAQPSNRYGVIGPRDNPEARREQLREATEFGMIGMLHAGAGGDPSAPVAPWGRDDSLGGDPLSARGSMFDDGAGGLGLSGIGEGGGGRGLGLGNVSTLGHGAAAGGAAPGFGSGAGRPGGSHRASGASNAAAPPAPAQPPLAPIAREIPIDPNGRFVTTYRPGGGHLSAFESAVSRGLLPPSAREVVSDVGARYAPVTAVPAGKALGLRADQERGKIGPSGGPFHLRVALQSTGEEAQTRPHLSVHLVLDISGSMRGESITQARAAAAALVDKLDPTDDFSFTTFSTSATVRVPDAVVGRRKEDIKHVIEGIEPEGGTNIGEGLARGYEQASAPGIPADAMRVVLLLSDGRANEGITAQQSLSRLALDAFQKGIQTSSFGLGTDYDGALMSSIANEGAGGYYYLKSADQIAPALVTELDKRLDPVATAVEVRVRLKPGVDLLKVYGSRRLDDGESARVRALEVAADRHAEKRDHIKQNRHDEVEGGMRFFIPAFARQDSHALLFKLNAPAGSGSRSLGLVELKYKDRVTHKNVVEELPLTLDYADGDAESAATLDASVARTVQGFAAGEALSVASSRIAVGDRAGAASLLMEREAILRHASETLREPLFLRDADRLARLRAQADDGQPGDPLVLAMLLETAGRSHLR